VSYSRPAVYAYVPNFISIGLFCRPVAARKTPIFAVFWTSAFSDAANCHQFQKAEHVCITTNLLLSNGIKIVSVLQRLHGETDKETKKLNVFGHPGGGCNPRPTELGMVIEDLEHVLAPLRRLGSDA